MRQGSTINYLLGDHLGSTAMTYNASTGATTEQRYKPWGEQRYPSGASTLPTRYQFTGQRNDSEIGLYFYNARFYSPYLNRWLSPDTIVPDPTDPQSFNRYSYTRNNPLRYIDPTGHCFTTTGQNNNEEYLNCTQDEFNAMTWNQRQLWAMQFSKITAVDTFLNIIGILDYFGNDPVFQNSAWAKLSDAGGLFVIEHGYNTFKNYSLTSCDGNSQCGSAAGEWSKYFSSYIKNGYESAYSQWGNAEAAGVEYGTAIAEPLRQQASLQERVQIDWFVGMGNNYRDMIKGTGVWGLLGGGCRAISDKCFGYIDPSSPRSGGFVNVFSNGIINGIANMNFEIDKGIMNLLKAFQVPVSENLYANP